MNGAAYDTVCSLDEVAAALGITKSRAHKLECQGIERLRRCFAMIESGVGVDAAIEACKWQRRGGRSKKSGVTT